MFLEMPEDGPKLVRHLSLNEGSFRSEVLNSIIEKASGKADHPRTSYQS